MPSSLDVNVIVFALAFAIRVTVAEAYPVMSTVANVAALVAVQVLPPVQAFTSSGTVKEMAEAGAVAVPRGPTIVELSVSVGAVPRLNVGVAA